MPAKKATPRATTRLVTYEIEQALQENGSYGNTIIVKKRITVPSTFKVTYGPLFVGGKGAFADQGGGAVLRFYENDTKQRALFRSVLSFRDLSLPLMQEIVTVEAEAVSEDDGKGNTKGKQTRKVATKFEEV
jgi:hypothetical protein